MMSMERDISKNFSAPFIIIGLTNIVFNGLLCHVLRKLKKLQTISYKFILIQSIADIGAGIVLLVSEITLLSTISDDLYGRVLVFARIVCDAVCQFSGTMILIVAVDRYIHMKYLSQYNTMMTTRRAAILVFNNLGSSLSMAVVNTCGVVYNYYDTSHLFMNCLAVTLYTTTFIIYYKAYASVSNRVNQMNPENQTRAAKRPSRDKEFARAVGLILVVFALCYTPFVIVSTVKIVSYCAGCYKDASILIAFYCARILVCSTSSLNAFLLIYFNKELKNYILRNTSSGQPSQASNTT